MPFVVAGSVLLGVPGAPGCTTTGFAESVPWPRAARQRNSEATFAPAKPTHNVAKTRALTNFFIWIKPKFCHRIPKYSKTLSKDAGCFR